MNASLARALLAEAVGTFALVFAGCGAIMVDATTHSLGHIGVACHFPWRRVGDGGEAI